MLSRPRISTCKYSRLLCSSIPVVDSAITNSHYRHADEAYHLAPDYCGECYGAEAPSNAKKPGCCNTCTEVRDAYAAKSWSFGLGDNVEQCQREHYAEHVIEQRKEGCRIEGGIRVNKVIGNFHFAPGKSFSHENVHLHDLAVFRDSPEHHSFSHSIHHMRFGPELPEGLAKRYGGKAALAWTNHHASPLDGTEQLVNEKTWSFMYFIKVVPTAYLPLGWETQGYHPFKGLEDNHHEDTALGKYGMSELGSVETHQYSVTSHKRSLFGGDEEKEGHKERIHSSGGIPGIFFSYVCFVLSPFHISFLFCCSRILTEGFQDISPMKVINRESRSKSFSSFLVGVCAVIGGTLTVAAAIDRGWYEGRRRMAGEKQHER